MLSVAQIEAELALIRRQSDRAINVNFFCHQPPENDPEVLARWHSCLQPYFDQFGVDVAGMPRVASRQPFSATFLAAIAPFRPEVVSFHFGLPEQALCEAIKAWGGRIIASATTLEEALWLEAEGADAVIAQGVEAGGHRGHFLPDAAAHQVSTSDLVRDLVAHLKIPVIAAGGIATPEDVAGMLALGALGVQAGTAFLLTPEAQTSVLHRAALKSDLNQNTALTNLLSGRPARGMMNRLMQEKGPMSSLAPTFPLASNAITALRSKAEAQGLADFSPLWAGTRAAECREQPAAEVVRWLAGLDTH